MTDKKNFDVIIIGGSYSGLSAAMALGRSLRSVLIIDSGLPCNRQTPHSHNFITNDGETPGTIAAKAKKEVLSYNTVQFINEAALSAKATRNGFLVATRENKEFSAKKLILATGIKDIMPDIKGFKDCWGISVIHCPYCHGFENRSKKTGILANGERAFHLSSLVNNLTTSLSILTSGEAEFNDAQKEKLEVHGIAVIEKKILEIENANGQVKAVVFDDGNRTDFEVLYAAIPFTQHSDIPHALGCEQTETGHIKTDPFQKTTVAGVFACGDASSLMRSVASSVYTGNMAGAMVNKELTDEQF